MAITDKLIKLIKEKGWAALSTIYFDNALSIDVYNTRGYVAINPDEGLVYSTGIVDITDTTKMEGQCVIMPEKKIYNQQTVSVYDLSCVQSFSMAHYSYWYYYNDGDKDFVMPKVPTKDEIMAYKLSDEDKVGSLYDDEGTYVPYHLFTGAAQSELILLNKIESVIPMFEDDNKRASLVIGWWQMFFNNQAKFIEAIKKTYGDTNLI